MPDAQSISAVVCTMSARLYCVLRVVSDADSLDFRNVTNLSDFSISGILLAISFARNEWN